MSNSINLNLPYLLSNQAQKHVTHNEALKMLDVLVQLSVVDNTLSTPPQSPGEGDSYTIASSPTGVWAGKENQVTIWHDGAWSFYSPNKGWITWVESNNTLQAYNGTDWVDISGVLSASTAPILGINATADTINRLSVNSAAILFNKEVDDVQVKLNKQASTDNASFLFQTNFSGRAEIGATGDDDFHFKVSSDGTTWNEGIIIDADTGEVSFPNTTLNISSPADPIDELVTRIFNRVSPTQWGFCHVVSEAYTDLAKTTKAVAVDDVIAVIEDKSPNNLDLVAGGTDATNKIKLRLDPATVGVDASHATTHFLEVTVPAGGFEGTLIMAYRSGCFVHKVEFPAGVEKIWSGDSPKVASGFIGAFAAESISEADIEAVLNAFYHLGADSKPITSANSMFYGINSHYKSIDLKGFDFSETNNFSRAFRGTSHTRIDLSGRDLGKVTNMYQAFVTSSSIRELDVSNWDVSKVTNMYQLFGGCSNIRELDVSAWDTSSLVTARLMFDNCSSLRKLDVSNWNTENVTILQEIFKNCSSIPEFDVSGWDTGDVTTTRSAFESCSSFEEIDISNWNLINLVTAYGMFKNCSKLKSINVGSVFDNASCINFTNAFINTSLDQQTVDDILVSIENAGTSNGTLNMTGANTAAPSSVGSTAKSALQGRGWTVTTQ